MQLANLELDSSKCISLFMKLCLKFLYNFMCIDSFIPAKFDDYSLIIVHSKWPFNRLWHIRWKGDHAIDHIMEIDWICSTHRKVYSLETSSCETRRPGLSVRGWRMHLWTIQYNIIQYNTIQYNTIQYNTNCTCGQTGRLSTMYWNAILYYHRFHLGARKLKIDSPLRLIHSGVGNGSDLF
jgi:hypothetical protein